MEAEYSQAQDGNMTVQEGLKAYFQRYGLGDGRYEDPYHFIWFLKYIPLILPNPAARKRALRRHDLNHVLTGYDTLGHRGELDISAFELGCIGGCGDYWVAWLINLSAVVFGIFVRPRALIQALARAEKARNSYSLPDLESCMERTLASVRRELNILPAPSPPYYSYRLYGRLLGLGALGAILILLPLAALFGLWRLVP